MKKFLKWVIIASLAVALGWLVLTIWVESTGAKKSWEFGDTTVKGSVLIVYDPDPFYNLDEQICRAMGQTLARYGMQVKVVTVAAARELKNNPFNLYVFCANTYNWRPDRAVSNYIKNQALIRGKPVVAITLGAGSTETSQAALERIIIAAEGKLVSSRSFFLLRPNDKPG